MDCRVAGLLLRGGAREVLEGGEGGGGEGGDGTHLARAPSPKKKEDSIDAPPEILRRLTAGARRWPGPKIQQKKKTKMGFLESVRRGGLFMYLVGEKLTILMVEKNCRRLGRQTS